MEPSEVAGIPQPTDQDAYSSLPGPLELDLAVELSAGLAADVEAPEEHVIGRYLALDAELRHCLVEHLLDDASLDECEGVAALEMVDGLAAAGLPPAHVGLHAGPVLFQEGDYFGQTVNLTARIADYARPGEVLVSQAVASASKEVGIAFADIGSIELKGVAGTTHVLRAHTA